MKKAVRMAKKILILLIGLPLFALGIILIPLPGPGLLVSLLALFILSLEFEQARSGLEKAKRQLVAIYRTSKARADRITEKIDKN